MTPRVFNDRSAGKHRKYVSRRQRIAAALVAVLVFVAAAIAQERAGRLPFEIKDLVKDAVSDDFPGELEVIYGSFQATTALFPHGMPNNVPADTEVSWTPWALRNGGVLAWRATVDISFKGEGSRPIYIDDIRLVDLRCTAPPQGLFMPPGGAGDTADRWIELNLDTVDPNVHRALTSDSSEDALWRFPLWVSDTEQEVVSVYVRTWDRDCTFALDVIYRSGNKSRSIYLTKDDSGRRFRIVGPRNANSVLRMPYGAASQYQIVDEPPRRADVGG